MFGTPEEIEAELQRLADQFEDLLAGLRRAKTARLEARGEDRSGEAAVIALDAVLEFLTWMPEFERERLHEPLAHARSTLLNGRRHWEGALLERPACAAGRAGDASDWPMRKVAAACAMYLYTKAGVSRRDAALEVAGLLDRAGWSLHGKRPGTGTMALQDRREQKTNGAAGLPAIEERRLAPGPGKRNLPAQLIDVVRKMPVADADDARKAAAVLIDWVSAHYPVRQELR